MERILNFLDKSTNGKCYKSFKYSLDDLEVPSLIYDDKPKIVLQPKAETDKRKQKYISVKEEAEKYKGNSIFKYFLDGSRKTYKVNAARKSKVDDNTARMQSIKQLGV